MAQKRLSGPQIPQAHLDIPREGVAEVMEPEARDLGLLECCSPRLLDADETGLCLAVPEHVVRSRDGAIGNTSQIGSTP